MNGALVTFEMRGENNFRKTYLRGVLKELNARLRGGVNFLTPCTPTETGEKQYEIMSGGGRRPRTCKQNELLDKIVENDEN